MTNILKEKMIDCSVFRNGLFYVILNITQVISQHILINDYEFMKLWDSFYIIVAIMQIYNVLLMYVRINNENGSFVSNLIAYIIAKINQLILNVICIKILIDKRNEMENSHNIAMFVLMIYDIAVAICAGFIICYVDAFWEEGQVVRVENEDFDNIHELFQNDSCSICLEEYDSNKIAIVMKCDHMFHKKCIEKWINEYNGINCPICRENFFNIEIV
jgi:hypothetical protein